LQPTSFNLKYLKDKKEWNLLNRGRHCVCDVYYDSLFLGALYGSIDKNSGYLAMGFEQGI